MFQMLISLVLSGPISYVQEVKCINDFTAVDGPRTELSIVRNEDGSYLVSRYIPARGRVQQPEISELLISKAVCVFSPSDERIFYCDSLGKPQAGDSLGRIFSERHNVRGVIRGVDAEHRMKAQTQSQEYLEISIISNGKSSDMRVDVELGDRSVNKSYCRVKFTD